MLFTASNEINYDYLNACPTQVYCPKLTTILEIISTLLFLLKTNSFQNAVRLYKQFNFISAIVLVKFFKIAIQDQWKNNRTLLAVIIYSDRFLNSNQSCQIISRYLTQNHVCCLCVPHNLASPLISESVQYYCITATGQLVCEGTKMPSNHSLEVKLSST